MNSKYPIMWYQGAPIGPEHFQQDFLHRENQRKLTFHYILKNNWGIKELEFDDSELDQGIFKLKKLTAITQNYSLIEISEDDDIMIDLSLYKEELKDQSLFLFLSFPNNELTEQPNVNNPKYKEILQEVSDLNNKEEKVILKFLKPNYFLEVAKTQSLKNISLPIAKLTYNGMNYKLADYCPPIIELSSSKILVEDLAKLISAIKDKVNFLKNTKKTFENYVLLSNLSSTLFPLEKNLKNNDHPYEIYNELIHSLSYIFNFTKNNKLPTIPEYKHDNILGPFKELINYIYENVSAIKVTCLQKQFLKQIDKNTSLFSIEAPQKIKNNMIIIGVERNKAASYQDMQQWIEEATIATKDKITDTQLQRTLGTKRFLVKNFDELDVPKIDNLIIFGIETNNHYMTPNESLYILNMNKKTAIPEAIFLIENN